jgi:lysophospholipase L1-like esterase
MSFSLGLELGLSGGYWSDDTGTVPGNAQAIDLLGTRNGFAIDFVNRRMVVNDSTNPGNAFDGNPEVKLTKYGAQPFAYDAVKGLQLSTGRDFGIAMPTAAFPYVPNTLHVFARFTLDAADSADQRYLMMIANTGNNRFAMYTTTGAGFRWVTGDGTTADTETATAPLVANTEYRTFFGADGFGRTWVDHGGIVTSDQLHNVVAAAVTHIGIGGYPTQVLRSLGGYLAEFAVISVPVVHERRLSLDPWLDVYAAEGDSHTMNVTYGLTPAQFYPARVAAAVPRLAARNAGGSGDSSARMLAQVGAFLSKGAPDAASIYAGSNDTGTTVAAAPVPTATAFTVASAADLAAGSSVIVNGQSRRIATLTGNALTLATALPSAPAAGTAVAIDTQRNIEDWIIAVRAAGTARVAVVGAHYLNWPASGDTPTNQQPLRAALRAVQQQAATAQAATYVDTYAAMRNLITGGQAVQGDWATWHQGATDTHLTAAGEQVLADAVRAALF